ncbi:hypothetical protein [Bacillus wiedmannii]|uniref:hypothetical protein n=1 Tax=Bacillus wiedmannii TaxID=1890302 RepID=UPI0015CF6CCA|nr:hypothetical protein [Bacillus wiedmannii]
MIYVAICKECQKKHADIVEKKLSKGCFQMVREADSMSDCFLDYMHDEAEEDIS